MRKFVGIFLAALGGGFFSVVISNSFKHDTIAQDKTATPSVLVDNTNHFASTKMVKAFDVVDLSTAAEKVVAGVVHVKIRQEGQEYIQMDPFQQLFGYGGGQLRKSPDRHGAGSGVVISNDGYIVTNNHVIEGADEIEVTLSDEETYTAKLIGTDPSTDIALLKVDGEEFDFVKYGNSDKAKLGEWVLAVGNPLNLTSTVTAGIISAKGRSINIIGERNKAPIESFIQTDAAVNPGNSGGALVNANGELIGINTAIKSPTGSYTGYSFAVPVNIVKKVVDDLLEYGTVQRGYIGVSIREVDNKLAEEKGLKSTKGIYVAGLMEDGAADDAGIEKGDVIKKVGNVEVDDVPALQEQVSKFRPGDKLIVTVDREGKEKQFDIILRNKFGNTELMKAENKEMTVALGAEFSPVTKGEAKKLGIDSGMKITSLNGGKFRSAGIKEEFIITKVDKKKIENFDQLITALKGKKGGVLIEGIYPNGKRAFYGLGM